MKRATLPVSDHVFWQVYDSPASLPGRHKWLTPTDEACKIESLLGMPANSIGAPLWVSGDRKRCPTCRRETTWLDIVASALGDVHKASMMAQVILGDQKYVNIEAPRAIAGLKCFQCKTPIDNLRSFKCHNWAYANPALLKVIEQMNAARKASSLVASCDALSQSPVPNCRNETLRKLKQGSTSPSTSPQQFGTQRNTSQPILTAQE